MFLTDDLDFPARRARFCRIAGETAAAARTQGEYGFGTLQEKRLHAILKKYLCDDTDFHEVGVPGTRFLLDIRIGDEVCEVQTGNFAPLKQKLQYLLENTACTVTVAHPLVARRSICWIDPGDGSVSRARRVGGIEKPIHLLAKLYPLLSLLPNERLCFRTLLLEVCDFRLLNPTERIPKRHTRRYERIPTDLLGEEVFSSPADFRALLPADLPACFPVSAFSNLTGLRGRDSYSAVRVLAKLGILRQIPDSRPMTFEKI